MKKIVLILLCFVSISVAAQDILGKWKTIDEKTGKAISVVEIYEENGKFFGKIIEILDVGHEDDLCTKCKGDEKDRPVLGLVIVKNMVKDGEYYRKGTIFHPVMGRNFRCRIKLMEDKNMLQVRGYIAFLYGTQYWKRIN